MVEIMFNLLSKDEIFCQTGYSMKCISQWTNHFHWKKKRLSLHKHNVYILRIWCNRNCLFCIHLQQLTEWITIDELSSNSHSIFVEMHVRWCFGISKEREFCCWWSLTIVTSLTSTRLSTDWVNKTNVQIYVSIPL